MSPAWVCSGTGGELERGAPSFSSDELELPAPTGDIAAIAGEDRVKAGRAAGDSAAVAMGHRPRAARRATCSCSLQTVPGCS